MVSVSHAHFFTFLPLNSTAISIILLICVLRHLSSVQKSQTHFNFHIILKEMETVTPPSIGDDVMTKVKPGNFRKLQKLASRVAYSS